MISFEDFCTEVKEHIREYMPEEYQQAKLIMEKVVKQNDFVRTGLALQLPGSKASPVIYLNDYYRKGMDQPEMESKIEKMAETYQQYVEEFPVRSIPDFQKFSSIKDYISYRLVNRQRNILKLSGAPYRRLDDMAVAYEIDLTKSGLPGSVLVDESMLQMWDISEEQLEQTAAENAKRDFRPLLKPLYMVISEMLSGRKTDVNFLKAKSDFEGNQYLLSNEELTCGAAVMLMPDVLKRVRDVLGTDFYLLPSSIHETIVIPKPTEVEISPKELKDMLKEVNDTECAPEDILSYSVYEYREREGRLRRAGREEKERGEYR